MNCPTIVPTGLFSMISRLLRVRAVGRVSAIEFASLGDAIDFGDLSVSKGRTQGHVSSPTRGIAAGGFPNANNIQYIQLMSKGDSVDFGDLTRTASDENAGASNGHGGLG